jgi:hypothetical protein
VAYTARRLITNSYYLAGITARRLQTVSGQQISDGLELLNDVLGVKTAQTTLIPYYEQYDFDLETGVQDYFIPNLLAPESMVFYIGTVRYEMYPTPRREFFGSSRVDNVNSLPFNWHYERTLGGSNISVYFWPAADYPAMLFGKFGLTSVTLNQDLELTYDRYYITYLRYALADYIAADNNITLQPQTAEKLKELEAVINNVSPPDLRMTKMSTFGDANGLNWGDVNLGKGWRPGGT